MTRVVICDMPYKYSKERDVCLFLCLSRLFLTFLSEGDGCTACSIVCLPKHPYSAIAPSPQHDVR